MNDSERATDNENVREALERLEATIEDEGVTTAIHDDDSKMTPMLVVHHREATDRAQVLRRLFHADGPVAVDSVHSHRIVVREA